jgi:hypothetical protein
MIRRHLILRAFIPAMAAAALVASVASTVPAQGTGWPAARRATKMQHRVPSSTRVDAAAHTATIRGIGAALAERAGA